MNVAEGIGNIARPIQHASYLHPCNKGAATFSSQEDRRCGTIHVV